MMRDKLLERLAHEKILILDGAMGTEIQKHALKEADFRAGQYRDWPTALYGDNEMLCIAQPHLVYEIHASYLAAGADIITTNSFGANRISQADYGLADVANQMALEAARIADRARLDAEKANPARLRFVAGSIGPTPKSLSISPRADDPGYRSIDFDELAFAYEECAHALISGGADILLVETAFDTLNAKAAIYALGHLFAKLGKKYPVMISGAVTDRSGRNLCGQSPQAFAWSVEHVEPFAIGLNCSLGTADLLRCLEDIAASLQYRLSVHPNAGLPDEFGEYHESPESMSRALFDFASNNANVPERGLNIAGGCCGTDPEHIMAIARALEGVQPRRLQQRQPSLRLAGLDPMEAGNGSLFVNIGERTNVSGSRRFAKLIGDNNLRTAIEVAREQVESGAQIIDVNLDDPLIESASTMPHFLKLLTSEPDIARVPVMIDSSHWETLVAGLKCLPGKGIANSISLDQGEEKFLEKAQELKLLGAAVLVMAIDEAGQASTYERRVSIVERAYQLLVNKAHYFQSDIIMDPNIFPVGTGIAAHKRFALEYFDAVRFIKKSLPGAFVSGGVSNVSFSFRGNDHVRSAMHTVFIYHGKAAGMDMGIVNPGQLEVYDDIDKELRDCIEALFFDTSPNAEEALLEVAQRATRSAHTVTANKEWRSLPVEKRIRHALLEGIDGYLREDIDELRLQSPRSLDIIEGPLMQGMNIVGDLFGDGKMFLPQVIRSARVMKEAVALLVTHIEKEEGRRAVQHTLVMATVKGDVHDIGKNIAAVVIGCNGYRVIDLGVMVPAEAILDRAQSENADAVGLSGLITPSLHEMVRVARAMQERAMKIPLLIGGATTSPIHTAVRIAPEYEGPVVHVRDASRASGVLEKLFSSRTRDAYISELEREHEELREKHKERQAALEFVSLAEAWQGRYTTLVTGSPAPRVQGIQDKVYRVRDLENYIDWTYYLVAWEFRGKYPAILDDPEQGKEARRVIEDARAILEHMKAADTVAIKARCSVMPAFSQGNDILIFDNSGGLRQVLPCLRQQRRKKSGEFYLCHADFIKAIPSEYADCKSPLPPQALAGCDWLGAFVVSVFDKARAESQVDLVARIDRAGKSSLDNRANKKTESTELAVKASDAIDKVTAPDEITASNNKTSARMGLAEDGQHPVTNYDTASDSHSYESICARILLDRLAEAGAEKLHEDVRKTIWGYAQMEALNAQELFAGGYQGIRPAPGYPSNPDHREKEIIFELVQAQEIGSRLSESCMIIPTASVAGWYFAHPESRYFAIGKLSREQVVDFARRKGEDVAVTESWLRQDLGY